MRQPELQSGVIEVPVLADDEVDQRRTQRAVPFLPLPVLRMTPTTDGVAQPPSGAVPGEGSVFLGQVGGEDGVEGRSDPRLPVSLMELENPRLELVQQAVGTDCGVEVAVLGSGRFG